MSTARPSPAPLDPIAAKIAGAPWAPEQIAALEQDMADIAAGREHLVPHEELPAWLEDQARERGEFDE
jgi:predicted transcriptional regulator